MANVARKHPRLALAHRVSGPSNDLREASESMRMTARADAVAGVDESGPVARVAGVGDDIKNDVKNAIKKYVIDKSFSHDDSTGAYMQLFVTKADAVNRHAGSLGADDPRDSDGNPASGLIDLTVTSLSNSNVRGLLDATGVWDSMSSTEHGAIGADNKCVSCDSGDLTNSVMRSFGDETWLNWASFKSNTGLADLADAPPAPDGNSVIWGVTGDYIGWHPPPGVPAGEPPAGIAMAPGTDGSNGTPYWYVPGSAGGAPPAPKSPFAGMHVGPRASTAIPTAVAQPQPRSGPGSPGFTPPPTGYTDTQMEAAAFGVPTAIGAVAAIHYGWRAFAIGGVAGIVAAAGVFVWSRVSAKKV